MFLFAAPKNFAVTLNESTEKLVLHGQKLARAAVANGDASSLSICLSSAALAKAKLANFDSALDDVKSGVSKENSAGQNPFAKSKTDLAELMAAVTTQLAEYHSTLVTAVVIEDGESQDWALAKPYYEGERISTAIQFWGYHMQVCVH